MMNRIALTLLLLAGPVAGAAAAAPWGDRRLATEIDDSRVVAFSWNGAASAQWSIVAGDQDMELAAAGGGSGDGVERASF